MAGAIKAFACAAAVACCGCLTNNYENYYVDSANARNVVSIHGDAPVTLRTATTEDDVISLMEEGYMPSGSSSFSSPYVPFSCAIDTAKAHGAALVLLDVRFKQTEQRTSVVYLPSHSTSYVYGRYGYCAVDTTTWNAVPVQRNIDIYAHDAMFFKKIDVSQSFGVLWDIPKRLPTEPADASIAAHILAVLHGSRAEKMGLKRGQLVKSINGNPVRTRRDIAPFIENDALIKEMEAVDEQ